MKTFLICIAIAFALFMGTYRLVETPPTWMDEGAIVQVAMNLATQGTYSYQVAPDTFISAGFLTTSYPLIFPLAIVFKIFGVGLYQARTLMVLFIILFIVVAYRLIKEEVRDGRSIIPALSLLLLVSFAPIYGHGKNVLGEVPGLVFFLSMLYFISLMEKGSIRWGTALAAGLCGGLAMATKPIYLIVVLPALILTMFWFFRIRFPFRRRIIFIMGCIAPLVCWVVVRLMSDMVVPGILLGNPDSISTLALVTQNIKRFVSEFQPMYFLGLMLVWWTSIYIRQRRNRILTTVECIAVIFSSVNLFAYVVTLGYYRYFFPGEIVAIIFFANSLRYVFDVITLRISWMDSRFFFGTVIILLLFQSYQTLFNSWISEYKDSNRSALLSQNVGSLPVEKTILFYNVPEAVSFLSHENYFQYLRFADSVVLGENNILLLEAGIPDTILVDQKFDPTILPRVYIEKVRFDKYTLFEKNDKLY